MLPDADVLAFSFGVPYDHPFGHRGATHSLAFAAGMAAVVGAAARAAGSARSARIAAVAGLVVASHPVLDAMTTGGLGVALWWPVSDRRLFLPWRPIPVSPLGRSFLSARGLAVVFAEVLPSAPLLVWALWRRAPTPGDPVDS
jgi:inner membrane protein